MLEARSEADGRWLLPASVFVFVGVAVLLLRAKKSKKNGRNVSKQQQHTQASHFMTSLILLLPHNIHHPSLRSRTVTTGKGSLALFYPPCQQFRYR